MIQLTDKVLQLLLNRLPVTLLYLASDGRIVRHIGNLLNLTPAELDGKSIGDWFPRCQALLDAGQDSAAPFEYLVLELEAPFFRSYDAYLVPEAEGEVSHVLMLVENTNEVVNREKFEQLFEHAGQPLLMMDASGLTDCNEAAVSMLGCSSRQEVLACGHVAVFSPPKQPDGTNSVEKFVQMMNQARIKGIHRFDWLQQRINGEIFPGEVTLLQLPHQSTLLCMIQDLTARTALLCVWENMEARRDAERKLRENDHLFRDIAQNVPGLIYQRRESAEGEVSYPFVSHGGPQVSGQEGSGQELNAEDLTELELHPEDKARYQNSLAHSRTGLTPWHWEGRVFNRRQQRYLWVEGQANPRPVEGDAVVWTGTLFNISDRKRIEAEIRHSQAHLEALLESIQDGIWSLDRALRLQTFNSRIRDLFAGLGAELVAGMELESILLGSGMSLSQTERWLGYFQHALQGRYVCTDYQYMQNGEKFFLEFSLNPILVEDEVTGVVTSVRDITHRRRADELLNEQRMRHEKILNFLPLSIYEKDGQGRYTFVNEQAVRVIGRSAEQILGRSDRDIYAPEVAARLMADDRRVRSQVVPKLVIEEEHRFDGGAHTFLAGKSLLDPNLPIESPLVGYAIDITERKQFELHLEQQKNFIRHVIDTIPHLVYVRDAAGALVMVNLATARLLGDDPQTLEHPRAAGLPATVVPDHPLFSGALVAERQVLSDHVTLRIEESLTLPDGHAICFDTIKTPIYMPDGALNVLSVSTDITERKQFEADLSRARDAAEQASLAKSAFLANMSHEIRTPLNAVIGFSELLEKRNSDPRHQTYLGAIKAGGRALMTLINDILDLSKIEAGKLDIVWEQMNPRQLFEEMQGIFAHSVQERGLSFGLMLDPALPERMVLDETRLRQILFNLIGNAIKFTENGSVSLSVSVVPTAEPDRYDLIVDVEDTGIGIAPEACELIFESFRQQDSQTTKKYGGTGLGLAISRRLAEMMNGSIAVTSVLGQGSRFRVCLCSVRCLSADDASVPAEGLLPPIPAGALGADGAARGQKPASDKAGGQKLAVAKASNGNGDRGGGIAMDLDEEILTILQRDIIPMYEATRKNKNFKLIQQLAREIHSLGQHYRLESLSEYGTRLELSVEQFDVTSMNSNLNAFPALVEQIRITDRGI